MLIEAADSEYVADLYRTYLQRAPDPDGFTASTSYNYDMGVARQVQTPLPNVTTNQPGPLSRRYYDAARRMVKSLNIDTGAYTRAVYPAEMDAVESYTLIESGVESYAARILDGAGRTRATARSLPGSAGQYAGQVFELDSMGRPARQSNPTETNAGTGWAATGDDAASGWLYTQTTYDWKGRPLVITHPKVNPADPDEQPVTREFEYGGCGCAGGEVVTMRGELVPTFEPAPAPAQGRRTQKIYFDELGRAKKTELLKWDGSVYSTTTTKYNALDEVVRVRDYVGALTGSEPEGESTGYQTTTMTYDGYGRLRTRRLPQYGTASTNVDTFEYNPDDTVQSTTDPRGVKAHYLYNNRHAVRSITYDTVGDIPDTPDVAYDYDAAGNRKWMTDGFGRADYTYDSLSRLKDETRTFSVPTNGIAYGQPAFSNSFKLAYEYTAGGQLRSVTDSSGTTTNYHGSTVGYDYDAAGRLLNVNGSGFAGVSQYASGFTYRAWGAPKSFTYANGLTFDRQYDTRLRVSQYTIGGRTANQQNGYAPPTVMKSDFHYYDGERIKYSHDLVDAKFDTAYTYDWAGRLVNGYSGSEAYDFFHGTNSGSPTGAYRQTYTHDAWDNLVGRTGNYWGQQDNYSASYNHKNRQQGWHYDEAGNVSQDFERTYTRDAAGRVVEQHDYHDGEMTQLFDGDGQRLGSYQGWVSRPNFYSTGVKYYLHSSVLGSVISDIGPDGLEAAGYVYANGELLARQQPGGYAPVQWVHHNPVTGSYQLTDQYQWSRPQANFDPAGVDVGYAPPQLSGSFQIDGDERGFLAMSSAFASNHRCYLNGLELSNCALVQNMLQSGAADVTPFMQTISVIYQGQRVLAVWQTHNDGYHGFVPVTAWYVGAGHFIPHGPRPAPRLEHRSEGFDTNFAEMNGATGERQLGRIPEFMLRDITGSEKEALVVEVTAMYNRPRCKTFWDQIFNKLKSQHPDSPPVADDLLGVLDSIDDQEGFVMVGNPEKLRNNEYAGGYFSTVTGSQKYKTSQLLLNSIGTSRSEALMTVMHESMHDSGSKFGYDDRAMAEAVFGILADRGLDMTGVRKLPDQKNIGANSTYWQNALSSACRQ